MPAGVKVCNCCEPDCCFGKPCVRPGPTGLVQSTSTLPASASARGRTAVSLDANGVAGRTTSASWTACSGGAVLAEEAHKPELIRVFRERIVTPRRAMLGGIRKRGRESGEVRLDADVEAAVNLLVGAFYARYLADFRVPERFARDAVSIAKAGIRANEAQSGGKTGRTTASSS